MYLVDTNIFLELLLAQEKSKQCKAFLNANVSSLNLTDFSLHSIGVILFRYNKKEIFRSFYNDISTGVSIISLRDYNLLLESSMNLDLDFDDIYQYCVAKENGLNIVTMDRDFSKARDLKVVFL